MVKYKNEMLNVVFAALADPTLRTVPQTLEQGSLSVGQLAAPHGILLPGFMKHLQVLENAGLVSRTKDGRVVSLAIAPCKAALPKAGRWSISPATTTPRPKKSGAPGPTRKR